jgi:hypothetical protein
MDFATYNFEPLCCECDACNTTHQFNRTINVENIIKQSNLSSSTNFVPEPHKSFVRIVKDDNGSCVLERFHALADGTHKIEREPLPIDSKFTAENKSKNYLDRNRYVTYVQIKDFNQLPRFFINMPHFSFDSHGVTTGWRLDVKQRWYANTPGKLVVFLIHEPTAKHGGIKIRIDKNSLGKRIETVEDVAELFAGAFDLVHASTVVQMPKALGSYTDEELLAEVSRRARARLGDYRGPKKLRTIDEAVDIDNVIEFTKVREVKYDQEKLQSILVA